KTPDIRLFDVKVTDNDREDMLDFFADIARRIEEDYPPLPDLANWKFNDYKDTISKSLTDEEMASLEMVNGFMKAGAPVSMRNQMHTAMGDSKRRGGQLNVEATSGSF